MANKSTLRISRDIADVQQGNDLSIAVTVDEADIRNVNALIIGPPATPYEYGFFEFSVHCGKEYPSQPPKVKARTTNSGRCRFNPNIYANGKVCLSILGTWQGERPGEEWSSIHGLESLLWSIQSLMSNTPYENEPGFDQRSDPESKKSNQDYCDKIRHETLRIAVIHRLEQILDITSTDLVSQTKPDPRSTPDGHFEEDGVENIRIPTTSGPMLFADLLKRRFLWYYEHYITTVKEYSVKHKDGSPFKKMPFENSGNEMKGKFCYTELGKRLCRIKDAIDQETESWAAQGLEMNVKEAGKAVNLQRQYSQLMEHMQQTQTFNLSIELDNGNPFVWLVTYFGKPMTHLDGGIFKIHISISPKHPHEQPRVRVLTPIYHHRVSKHGVLCYFPKKEDDIKHHVEMIIQALEEESPPLDPRTVVHPEATKLLWGSDTDKKKYYRQLRRSAQESLEECG